MYKKTTTIIEEHGTPPAPPRLGVANPYSPEATRLKLDIRDKLSLYTADMRNYVISKTGTTDDVTEIVEHLRMDMQSLITVIQPFFDAPLVELSSALTDTTNGLIALVNVSATGKDAQKEMNDARGYIDHLAYVLDKLGVMLTYRTFNIWNTYLNTITQQVTARLQKKWKDEQDSYDLAYYIMVSGQPVVPPATSTGFADLLTEGISNKV